MAGERLANVPVTETQKNKYSDTTDKGLETWKNWNKLTMIGSLGVGLFIPPVALLAVVDGAQIVAINEVQKRRRAKAEEKVVFDAKANTQRDYRLAA